jgi:anti-sigma28 factor (negative regulator of flagellin synthesis)
MEISPIQNYYKMQAAANPANAKRTAEDGEAPVSDARTADSIDISAEASFKAELNKMTKTYASKGKEEVSGERIAELKQKYQGDACPISGSDIASKIIAGILGPTTKD